MLVEVYCVLFDLLGYRALGCLILLVRGMRLGITAAIRWWYFGRTPAKLSRRNPLIRNVVSRIMRWTYDSIIGHVRVARSKL